MFIKKILIVLLLLTVLCALSSCNNTSNTTDQISNNDDLNIDTEINTDTNTTNNTTNTSTGSDLKNDTTDVEKEILTEFGNFTTLHQTIPSNDRMKQMRNSKLSYNTGSSYTPDELNRTRIQARIISSAKFWFPNAADLMGHYLDGTGETYELDIEKFLKDETAKENMLSEVHAMMKEFSFEPTLYKLLGL